METQREASSSEPTRTDDAPAPPGARSGTQARSLDAGDRLARLEMIMQSLPAMLQSTQQRQAHDQAPQAGPSNQLGAEAQALAQRLDAMEECIDSMGRWISRRMPPEEDGEREEDDDGRHPKTCANDKTGTHLSRSAAEIEAITRREPEFCKYILENISDWPQATLVDILKARRDYAIACTAYGPTKARRIFEDEDVESSALMRRMAAINEQERVMKEATAATARPASSTHPSGGMAETTPHRAVTDSGCFNCGGPHRAKDCPSPYNHEYRMARRAWEYGQRGKAAGGWLGQASPLTPQAAPAPVPQWPQPAWPYMGASAPPMTWTQQYAPAPFVGQPNVAATPADHVQAGPQNQ